MPWHHPARAKGLLRHGIGADEGRNRRGGALPRQLPVHPGEPGGEQGQRPSRRGVRDGSATLKLGTPEAKLGTFAKDTDKVTTTVGI